MKPISLFLALAAALPAVPVLAAGPSCPAMGGAGQSTNWGADYRERVKQIFDTVKAASGDGLDPDLMLININDLPKQGSTRMVEGSPLSALQKGTQGLAHDAVIYTFGVFEIACDEAQLAFFMAHEMKHIKKGSDGKNHLDRVIACKKGIFSSWVSGVDINSFAPAGADDATTTKAVMAAFDKAKGGEVATTCVKPVENEADAFATQLAPKLPYKVESDSNNPDPNRDARVQAFGNAEKWLQALGISSSDPAHGSATERADTARKAATDEAMKKMKDRQEKAQQSLPNGF